MKPDTTLFLTIIVSLIGMVWPILVTVMNQVEPEPYPYCRACHVCERRLCEDILQGEAK